MNKKLLIKICKNCKQEFTIKNDSKDKPRKYCSRKCSAIDGASIVSEKQKLNWKKEKESGIKRKPARPKRLVDLVCGYCKSEFTVPYKKRNHKFCSHECYSSSRSFDRIVKCEYCGTDFTEKSYKQKYCSMSCSGKAVGERQSGENNPFYGKTHTENTIKFLSETAKEQLEKYGNPFKGCKHNEETCKVMSDKAVQRIVDNDGKHPCLKGYKQGWFYSNKNNKEIAFDSSYEERYYQKLEADYTIKCYYRSGLKLSYISDGASKTYNPDLFIEFSDGRKELVEIKPDRLVENPENLAKHASARQYCSQNNIKFRIITEEHLFTPKDKDWGFLRQETKRKHPSET